MNRDRVRFRISTKLTLRSFLFRSKISLDAVLPPKTASFSFYTESIRPSRPGPLGPDFQYLPVQPIFSIEPNICSSSSFLPKTDRCSYRPAVHDSESRNSRSVLHMAIFSIESEPPICEIFFPKAQVTPIGSPRHIWFYFSLKANTLSQIIQAQLCCS